GTSATCRKSGVTIPVGTLPRVSQTSSPKYMVPASVTLDGQGQSRRRDKLTIVTTGRQWRTTRHCRAVDEPAGTGQECQRRQEREGTCASNARHGIAFYADGRGRGQKTLGYRVSSGPDREQIG